MQNLINFMMTPNEMICNLLLIPLRIIETMVIMNLIINIFNIKSSKKQKWLFIIIVSIACYIIKNIFSNTINFIFGLTIIFVSVLFIFKLSFIKSLLSVGITTIITGISEAIIISIFPGISSINMNIALTIPFYRFSIQGSSYLIIFLISLLIKTLKIEIPIIENMSKKVKKLLIFSTIIGILAITPNLIFINEFILYLPKIFIIYILSAMITFFFISIFTTIKVSELASTKQELENAEQYNKTLSLMYDNIRTFKHDFNNMVQVIGGYTSMNDMEGLKKYYSSLLNDCQKVNNLSALNPESINNPAIYGLLASKYHLADEKEIKINLEIFIDLNDLNVNIYKLTKILGILFDNAIEASEECEQKTINISMHQNINNKIKNITIENTYLNKDIDIAKIFEKDYSTKNRNTGVGLWEVKKIVDKTQNLELYTDKNDDYFIQKLEIS